MQQEIELISSCHQLIEQDADYCTPTVPLLSMIHDVMQDRSVCCRFLCKLDAVLTAGRNAAARSLRRHAVYWLIFAAGEMMLSWARFLQAAVPSS